LVQGSRGVLGHGGRGADQGSQGQSPRTHEVWWGGHGQTFKKAMV
jgi:hypothetical protein